MSRGEIWWVAFDPVVGTEIEKTRPAIIVSASVVNRRLPRVLVVPLSSQIRRVHIMEVVVTVSEGNVNKAMISQMRVVDKARLRGRMGALSELDLLAVERILAFYQGLN